MNKKPKRKKKTTKPPTTARKKPTKTTKNKTPKNQKQTQGKRTQNNNNKNPKYFGRIILTRFEQRIEGEELSQASPDISAPAFSRALLGSSRPCPAHSRASFGVAALRPRDFLPVIPGAGKSSPFPEHVPALSPEELLQLLLAQSPNPEWHRE